MDFKFLERMKDLARKMLGDAGFDVNFTPLQGCRASSSRSGNVEIHITVFQSTICEARICLGCIQGLPKLISKTLTICDHINCLCDWTSCYSPVGLQVLRRAIIARMQQPRSAGRCSPWRGLCPPPRRAFAFLQKARRIEDFGRAAKVPNSRTQKCSLYFNMTKS